MSDCKGIWSVKIAVYSYPPKVLFWGSDPITNGLTAEFTSGPRAQGKSACSLVSEGRVEQVCFQFAAVFGLSSACSMHVVRQQRKLCRWFVDMSAVWRDCHTSRRAVQIVRVYRRLVSASLRCTLACVQEATCGLANAVCTGSSLRLVTSATLGQPESHGRAAWDLDQYVPQRAGLAETVRVWKLEDQPAAQHGVTVVQSREDKCCD